jgi:S1-C subfamily serine protease
VEINPLIHLKLLDRQQGADMRTLFTSKVRLTTAVAVLLVCLTAAGPARAEDQALYQKTLQATGLIGVKDHGIGTCWVVDREQKLVITNKHVVGNGNEAVVIFPMYKDGTVVTDLSAYRELGQKLAIKGKVLYRDEKRDLALVQLEWLPRNVQALPLAKNSAAKDDMILSIGNSSIIVPAGQQPHLWKVRTGKVAAKGFVKTLYKNTGDQLEVSMITSFDSTRPGDSGGPVVNAKGELVAVTSGGTENGTVGLAVDVTEVRTFLARALVKGREHPATSPVAGTWTMTITTANGATSFAGLTMYSDGTCTFEGYNEVAGTYTYADGRLTLTLPGLGAAINATVTWNGDDNFEFTSDGVSFAVVRR